MKSKKNHDSLSLLFYLDVLTCLYKKKSPESQYTLVRLEMHLIK